MIKLVIKGIRPEKENNNYIIDAVVSSDDKEISTQFEKTMRNFPDSYKRVLKFVEGSLVFTDATFSSVCIALNHFSYLYGTNSCIVIDEFGMDKNIEEELLYIAEHKYSMLRG